MMEEPCTFRVSISSRLRSSEAGKVTVGKERMHSALRKSGRCAWIDRFKLSRLVRMVPLLSRSLTKRFEAVWNCLGADSIFSTTIFLLRDSSIAFRGFSPISCILAEYPPKYPAATDWLACIMKVKSVFVAEAIHFCLLNEKIRIFSCDSRIIGVRWGNLISPLSPVNTNHAMGPALYHGLLRFGSIVPSRLLGPLVHNPFCAAMHG